MTAPKTGPLTPADLQAIWESTSDEGFWRPLEEAGEGQGFEAYTQAWQQMTRVSEAVDTTTQAMFILPWSGQSAPPAAGAQKARVTLTLSRTRLLSQPLVLAAGTVVQEVITDWSYSGGIQRNTGRGYVLDVDVVFPPGVQGPISVGATAQRPGYGYNNPQPGTIQFVVQPGSGYDNDGATLRSIAYPGGPPSVVVQLVFIDAADEADAFLPDHVGQYLQVTDGFGDVITTRAVTYAGPDLTATVPTGGTLGLELTQGVLSLPGHSTGTFRPGEAVNFFDHLGASSGFGTLLGFSSDASGLRLVVVMRNGSILVDAANLGLSKVVGVASGASATVDQGLTEVVFPHMGAASWRVLDWVVDWGLSVTNAAQPRGGIAGMLDVLGKERNMPRATGEPDGTYRKRIAQIADVVTPNAIRRAVARVLGPGVPFCLREVGSTLLPGIYYDVPDNLPGISPDSYDNQVVLFAGALASGAFLNPLVGAERCRYVAAGGTLKGEGWFSPPFTVPANELVLAITGLEGEQITASMFAAGDKVIGEKSGAVWTVTGVTVPATNVPHRFHYWLDYTEMRAFFLIGIPPSDAGDFGMAYDAGASDAYDASPFLDFYDGYAVDAAQLAQQVYAAVDRVHAGGVGFDLYQINEPCQ